MPSPNQSNTSATIARYGTVLRIYDNGGATMDRYTIVPPHWATQYRERQPGLWEALASGVDPRGMSLTCSAVPGKHLGRRIHWNDLPGAVQNLARDMFPEFQPVTAKAA